MKKFLSAVIALTMMATTFVSSAFAAGDLEISAKAAKAEYNEGDKVRITIQFGGTEFNAFELGLAYDADVFEYVAASKPKSSDLSAEPTFGIDNERPAVLATFATAGNQKLEYEDEESGDMVPSKLTYIVDFKVKSNVKAGDYEFIPYDLKTAPSISFEDQTGKKLNAVLTNAKVHVNGTQTDKPAEVKAEFDTTAASKFTYGDVYNYGVGGTVTVPAEKSATGVTFDISNGTKTVNYDFDFGTSIAADASFGLNIYRVPVGVELSFSNLQVK